MYKIPGSLVCTDWKLVVVVDVVDVVDVVAEHYISCKQALGAIAVDGGGKWSVVCGGVNSRGLTSGVNVNWTALLVPAYQSSTSMLAWETPQRLLHLHQYICEKGRGGEGRGWQQGQGINQSIGYLITEVNGSTNERKKTLRSKGSSKPPTLVAWSYTIEYTIGQSYHGRANRHTYDTRSLVSIFDCGWERYLVLRKP